MASPRRPSKGLLLALAAIAAASIGAAGWALWERGAEAPGAEAPSLPRATTILFIQTEPPGAMVSLDGRALGPSPMTLDAVEVGRHELKATLEGRQDTTRVVMLSAEGEHATVVLVLPERPKDAPPDPQERG